MNDLIAQLRERDKAVRAHHEFRTGRNMPKPMTLEGMAADEIDRLRAAVKLAIKIIDTNLHHQREKVVDAASVLRAALAKE